MCCKTYLSQACEWRPLGSKSQRSNLNQAPSTPRPVELTPCTSPSQGPGPRYVVRLRTHSLVTVCWLPRAPSCTVLWRATYPGSAYLGGYALPRGGWEGQSQWVTNSYWVQRSDPWSQWEHSWCHRVPQLLWDQAEVRLQQKPHLCSPFLFYPASPQISREGTSVRPTQEKLCLRLCFWELNLLHPLFFLLECHNLKL